MTRLALAAATLLSAGLAQAAEPLSPQSFRTFAEGHTLYFSEGGTYYGAESYAPGNRSTWQFRFGDCVPGVWEARGGQICFRYADGEGDESCWRMMRDDRGYFVRLLGDDPDAGMELRVIRRDRKPLRCGGPSV